MVILSLKSNGSNDLLFSGHLYNWRIPQGFLHYIEEHGIKPSDLFIDDILQTDFNKLLMPNINRHVLFSLTLDCNIKLLKDGLNNIVFS